jgi:hypothetical protein
LLLKGLSELPRRGFLQTFVAALAAGGSRAAASEQKDRTWGANFDTEDIYGYVDRHSVVSGGAFGLMLSVKPKALALVGRVRFFRLGDYPYGRREVWTSEQVTVESQPVLRSAAAVGAAWFPILSVSTQGWAPGVYTADFDVADRTDAFYNLMQIVVRPPEPRGGILMKVSTSTWQAYNSWGGHSFYPDDGNINAHDRGAMVSFDRPTPAMIFEHDIYLIKWLERVAARLGVSLDYATSFDVHASPDLLRAYQLAICGSHDLYWTKEEFDAFEDRIFVQGKNTMFLGANTAYWQVRFVDVDQPPGGEFRGRQIVCHKSESDPIIGRVRYPDGELLATLKFRANGRRPETMLLGSAYQGWFQSDRNGNPRVPYRVMTTDFPFFAGTGLSVGDNLADVVGYEWDNRDPQGDGKRLWSTASRIADLPAESIRVLFAGHPTDGEGQPGLAEAVYFRSKAGAQVFNAGSARWGWGLGRQGFENDRFKAFNENLLTSMLAP